MRLIVMLLVVTLAGCVEDAEPEAPLDSDDDGYPDVVEEQAGSDPQNATSVPVIAAVNATQYPAWGPLAGAQIQPGASLGGYCTFNFLFEGPNNTGYIGTAAHCTDGVGERLELPGIGEIATVVYDSDDIGSTVDFSLARLDADKIPLANPKMLSWDGPIGFMAADDLAAGDLIQLHGYGLVLGQNDATRGNRQGLLIDWTADEYDVDMPAVNGDSGSPLMHESGKAFGIVSRYGMFDGTPSTDSGPLMPYIFRSLEAAGYGDVRLATV